MSKVLKWKDTVNNGDDIVPMQPASEDIWDKKYRLKDKMGKVVDNTIIDTFKRVAKALSDVEKTEALKKKWFSKFLWALQHGAIPAGRITSNAGAEDYKPKTSTINCTVSGNVRDSMNAILEKVHEAGLTLKAGCGIGYCFSLLRPTGAYVNGAGATTSGPLSFMDIYDKMCFTVSSAGGRRGAQMATFDVSHPDVMEFIRAKRENGRFENFNLSLLVTNDFIKAVKDDANWKLVFPVSRHELEDEDMELVYRHWPVIENHYLVNEKGEVACKVYKTIKAANLWDMIMASTYDFSDPGIILIDNYNEFNNNWFCENITATNPCGEQGLPQFGSCLLGSVNLTKFVRLPFTDNAQFDWAEFDEVVAIFTRMLDNVVEINGLPLPEQREEIYRKRRHGMGYLGLGSTLALLKIHYGSDEAVRFTEMVTKRMAETGLKTGIELAKEKGPAPIMLEKFIVTPEIMRKRPELADEDVKVGDEVSGLFLWSRSKYLDKFSPDLQIELEKYGCRFTHHTSIAPTGTISLSLANNASNGIEPSFAHHYFRNVIREGRKTKEKVDVFSYELLAYREYVNPNAHPDSDDPSNALPDYFVTADTLTPDQHMAIQAASQYWVDSSISKTLNVATDFPYKEFKGIYMKAFDNNLKGFTTYRENPKAKQGVLVREKDLASTTYRFKLEDGEVITVQGNEQIEYDGEITTAANLHQALKSGYYGRM